MKLIVLYLSVFLGSFVHGKTLHKIIDVQNEIDNEINVDDDVLRLGNIEEYMFSGPNEQSGKLLSEWTEESEVNPEELGEYAEGDILFPNGWGKNGMKAESFRWPGGVIPYEIKGGFSAFDMDAIERAINMYHNNTCIKFKPKSSKDVTWLRLTSESSGCWSSVGRVTQRGAQQLNLQTPGCLKRVGTVVHELMHAVGFLHEQNRPERDEFVNIAFQNIKYGHEHNFDKAKAKTVNDFGVKYDYGSVMHYSKKAFSRNGKETIIPKIANAEIGQRVGFSKSDIEKINRMYNCTL